MTKGFVILTLSALLMHSTHAVCYCPIVCENCYRSGDFKEEYGRASCNDVEAQQECERANWEISDMQISLSSLISIILDDALESKNMTALQVGFARSLLSLALEDNKPEGDCANGLSTETGIKGTLSHCYAPELLEQCAKVRDHVDDYQNGISDKFESFFSNNNLTYSDKESSYLQRSLQVGLLQTSNRTVGYEMHGKLAEIIEVVRFRTRIKTAKIRCASFEATQGEIDGSSIIKPSWIFTALALAGLLMSLV